MNKVIKIAVWLVLIIWGINQSFNMISQANTVARENFALGEMTSGLKYPESLEASITAIGWWIKRASYPEDRETTCVIWRLKFDKFTKSVITKLSNLLNKEL